MIRMIQSKSAGHAKAYFSEALAKSDYYISDQELAGFWEGKLAGRLGINGLTTKDAFFALCENRHPDTRASLTPRTKEDRTTGYDINFHCPKSVSLLHVLSDDKAILEAFSNSVSETMRMIEDDSKTRVRKGGQYDDRNTGELAWAQFIHQTARPVGDRPPDPHLHAHCFVFNATWDATEETVKACQFRDIKRDMPYYQAYFHKSLSDRLAAMGYGVRRTDKSFEIEGVSQDIIDLFSKRTDEIGRVAKEKGITNAKELDELGARTRSKKQKGTGMNELRDEWKGQINALDGDKDKTRFGVKDVGQFFTEPVKLTPEQCIDHALLHSFERASVMQDRRLLETAITHSIGATVSAAAITKSFDSDKRLVRIQEKSKTLCTTKEVLNEEKHMVDLAKQGQGKVRPLYQEVPPLDLEGQQAAAIAHVLSTNNRVSIVRGAAGTGKTTLMKEAISWIEKAGKTVTVVAPTAEASRGVLKTEGFAKADTVAMLLVDQKMQEKLKGQVLWVDEAGLLGTKDMVSLLNIAAQNNARLILGGDTRQHASVIRGDALRILNTVAGIKSAEVSKIYRQRNEEYKTAVEDLSKGNVKEGFEKLDHMGAIREINPMKPNDVLVNDYMAVLEKGKSALIICPTHAQGEAVTDAVRKELRSKNMIGKKEIEATKYTNLYLTDAEKKDVRSFQKGWIVQFNQNAPGFHRGSAWTVDKVTEKNVRIKNDEGETANLPTKSSHCYDVFTEEKIGISKGDKIRITRNGFDADKKRMNNGQALEVVSVSKNGSVVLKSANGGTYKIDGAFGHIAHAHCITSYAAQGKTVDEVFIAQPSATFAATDAKQFYVSVSRGRDHAHIYTDDKEALLEHARDLGLRQSALELVKGKNMNEEIIKQKNAEEYVRFLREETKFTKSKQRDDYEPEL